MIDRILISLLECTYDQDMVATLHKTESTFVNQYHDKPNKHSVIFRPTDQY